MSPAKPGDAKPGAGVAPPKKETSQWCDVGIMKGTTCVVSYYHLTSDMAQGNGEVSRCRFIYQCSICSLLLCQFAVVEQGDLLLVLESGVQCSMKNG